MRRSGRGSFVLNEKCFCHLTKGKRVYSTKQYRCGKKDENTMVKVRGSLRQVLQMQISAPTAEVGRGPTVNN